MKKVGRNDPCPCGSGKKYKSCHMNEEKESKGRNLSWLYLLLFVILLVIGGVTMYFNSQQTAPVADPNQGKVWSEEHQHYH